MTRRRRAAALALSLSSLAVAGPPAAGGEEAEASVQVTPVEFVVANPMEPGVPRTMRGDLFLPAGGAACAGVQLLFAGFSYGRWVWDLPGRPDYSYARAMARAGYPVVTVDLVGYGDSDRPANGRLVSTPGYADMAHQVVSQLRAGSYQGGPSRPSPRW